MGKNFKKFIAALLTIGTFTSTIPALAMKPAFPLTKRAISETLPELTSCVREFESIAPGVFYVDPYFKGPANKEPEITCTILKQVIKIFKQYPNITQKFIEQTQLTREKKFEIKPLNAETLKTFTLGIEINGRPPAGCYIVSENAIQLFISVDPEVLKSNYRPEGNVTVEVSSDPATYTITHEMGHLISSVIKYSENKDMFLRSMQLSKYSLRALDNRKNFDELIKILKEISSYSDVGKWLENIFLKTRKEIVELAKAEYGYTGEDGYLSIYGEKNDDEWIAEAVAYALCNERPNAIGWATRFWLEIKNTQLAVSK